MISVAQALAAVIDLGTPVEVEMVPLDQADGRVLAHEVAATRDQPPFSASAMDGYAIATTQANEGDSFTLIGEAAAGHRFAGNVGAGQTVRIFTGAPIPEGATRVIIQEDVIRDGDQITLRGNIDKGHHIRPSGGDFSVGDVMTAPRKLTPSDVALLASMNVAQVPVHRKPNVAIIATGDELVNAGETPRDDQIIASNSLGLAAMFRRAGATARVLPIAKDVPSSLEMALSLAKGADLLVTIGGASVGDHDIVAQVAGDLGLERQFYKVAMRPGKPLMAGRIGGMAMIGLPGNPVSSMICGELYVLPLIDRLQGLPAGPRKRIEMTLSKPLPANSQREHYMRAEITDAGVAAFERQDSSLLSVLSRANALIVRPPNDPARDVGDRVEVIAL